MELDVHRHVDAETIVSKSYKVLADIEGRLTITEGNRIIFEEEGVLVLELGVDLAKWVRDFNTTGLREFSYQSMDYDDEPILWSMRY